MKPIKLTDLGQCYSPSEPSARHVKNRKKTTAMRRALEAHTTANRKKSAKCAILANDDYSYNFAMTFEK